ncbi:serine/threonine-protein kinase [Streptomyces edwardsiae]|uniref:Serine/threonine protein kinase n=1 Tax=Streptomyces edwardsiae TaxID=3075527 RepID=A0ABU2PQU3_9ACTN|nr:serine/threonine protein kinase [Streptomyces sp. DSM 41636]MDT0394540.1 serine/threonine protein kinase [Streptomyces sp. DSM 41636]
MIELGGSGAEPLEDEDPRRIGPIPLVGRLGAGGMGRVYLGVLEGRYTAVKQLLPSVVAEDKDFLRRFGHELDNLARLPEHATAPLLAGDRTARPPWFATAYVPGLTLREALETHERPLPAGALWLLLREAAAGLAEVHALDMVHRDIKPSNVMLTLDGLTLIDFGVARAAEQSQLTRTGMVVGTPAYMSPEQASGARRSTGAVDIFALGSVLAYAASGRPPFGDESGHGVLYRIVHEEPDLDAVRALDPELAEVVTACLDKDYEGRPTAAELVELADRHGPFTPPLWPEAVTARLAERAAFAATTPDVPDVPEEPGEPGEPEAAPRAAPEKRERRTRVVPVIVPVVVVTTGATLAFTLLPYTFDAGDEAGRRPSASVTVSADATPSGTAGGSAEPSPSTSASPSKDSKEKDSRKRGSQESPAAAGAHTGDEAAKGGGGGGGDGGGDGGGGSASDTDPGTDTEADAPSTGGSTLRNARSGQCLISYGGAGYGNVATGDCASGAADWSLRSASSGTYRIVHGESGNCLSAYGAMHSGTCGADDAQTWRIGSGGTVVLVKTGRCLEHTQGGGTIMARVCDGSASQNWTRS